MVDLLYPGPHLAAALAQPDWIRYEPSPRGLPKARAAVLSDYTRRGVTLDDSQILLTASSSESYALLFKLFANPSTTVLIPEPSYPLFDHLTALEGLRTRAYQLDFDGRWHVDFSSLNFTDVAALILVSPNNPTGSYISGEDLQRLAKLAAEHHVPLIVDEVFADYPLYPPMDAVTAVAARPLPCLTFSLGGLSKSCGLPQLKLGWIAATGPGAEEAISNLEWIADTYLSVGGPVQHALPTLLTLGANIRSQIQERIRRNHASLGWRLRSDAPYTLLPCEAGWSIILRVPQTLSDEEWAIKLLREDGVLVQPGYFFELTLGTTLVLSLLPSPDRFDEGMTRLLARLDRG
jgi:aspartate/methionine/tyrosine aminotransferase